MSTRGKSGKRARLGRGLQAMIEPGAGTKGDAKAGPKVVVDLETETKTETGAKLDPDDGAVEADGSRAGDGHDPDGAHTSTDGSLTLASNTLTTSSDKPAPTDVAATRARTRVEEVRESSKSGGASLLVDGSVVRVPVDEIVANTQQPRREFDVDALSELAASIRVHGVMQAVTVRVRDGGGYELIAGERRLRASKLAGLETIPAVVRDVDDSVSAQLALLENIQREDLNAVERAKGFSELSRRHGMTQAEISDAVGVSRSAVANALRLLELSDPVLDMVRTGAVSFGHAKVLLGVESREAQLELAERSVRGGWSVRQLEIEAARGLGNAGTGSGARVTQKADGRAARVVADLEDRLSASLGTKVQVKTSSGGSKGRIEITFYDLDQFDGLLERLGVPGGG